MNYFDFSSPSLHEYSSKSSAVVCLRRVSRSLPAVVVRSLLLDIAQGNVYKESYSAFILQLRGRYLQCHGINLVPSCFVLPGQSLAISTEGET